MFLLEVTQQMTTKFFKFVIVGFTGMLLDFGLTFLFKEKVKMQKYMANALGFSAAASSNYIFNRIWTFQSEETQIFAEYSQFMMVSIIGLGLNSLILWLIVSKLKWNFYFSKLMAMAIVTAWNFLANALITFA